MKKIDVDYKGITLKFPVPEEGEIPFGMARELRKVKDEEERMVESIYLMLENFLDEKELKEWDKIPMSELASVLEQIAEDNEDLGTAEAVKK